MPGIELLHPCGKKIFQQLAFPSPRDPAGERDLVHRESCLIYQLNSAPPGKEAEMGLVQDPGVGIFPFSPQQQGEDDPAVADVRDADDKASARFQERTEVLRYTPGIPKVLQDVEANDKVKGPCGDRQFDLLDVPFIDGVQLGPRLGCCRRVDLQSPDPVALSQLLDPEQGIPCAKSDIKDASRVIRETRFDLFPDASVIIVIVMDRYHGIRLS